MDRIAEMLGRIAELSADELAELQTLIDARFDELAASDQADAETVAEMEQLIEGTTQARAETQRRSDEAAAAAAGADEARARMEAIRSGETGEETPTEGETVEQPEETPAEPTGEQGEDTPEATSPIGQPVPAAASAEPVTAGVLPRGTIPGSHIARMAGARRATGSPERGAEDEDNPYRVTVTAAAGLPDVNPGGVFEDPEQLAKAMSEKLRRIQTSRDHSAALVASARWTYPEDRLLDDNTQANTRKLNAICAPNAPRYDRRSGAIVASGGICLPTNVDYSVPTWVSTERPLRDALPSFQATRGGIEFVTPPDIGIVDLQGSASGSGLATGRWTEATDATPGGATKPVWQVSCGALQTVLDDAITTRVMMGNMFSRFAPEQVAANTEQAIAAAAREAELNLLNKMYSTSNQILAAQYLGAVRDLLASVDVIAEQYRYSHRYPRNIGLTAVFPEWVKGVCRADMVREFAHDNAGSVNVMSITDAQIEDWFSARGIDVIWTMDALESGTYGTGGNSLPNQYFPKLTAGGSAEWPNQSSQTATFTLGWLLYVTGTFQFIDGGRLDLGVVRDSLLDATNDYETFVETFENVAFRGNECYQVHSVLKPTGVSGGPTNPTYSE